MGGEVWWQTRRLTNYIHLPGVCWGEKIQHTFLSIMGKKIKKDKKKERLSIKAGSHRAFALLILVVLLFLAPNPAVSCTPDSTGPTHTQPCCPPNLSTSLTTLQEGGLNIDRTHGYTPDCQQCYTTSRHLHLATGWVSRYQRLGLSRTVGLQLVVCSCSLYNGTHFHCG